jgi:hypothetical protein
MVNLYLPREHGAYGQMAFPLVTAFGVAGTSVAGLLLATAVIAAFLAHEPAAVRFGQRGVRAAREHGTAAARWLWVCVAIALGAGIGAALTLEPSIRWSLAVPAVPALVLTGAMVRGGEKSWYGETAAALAFAGAAVPVALAAGAPPASAWHVAVPFALLFATTTLAVRVVILRVRGGGNPQATAATRLAVIAGSLGALMVIAALVATGVVSTAMLIAAAPGLAMAIMVAARPPAATRLRLLGWSLVTVSTLTAALVFLTA